MCVSFENFGDLIYTIFCIVFFPFFVALKYACNTSHTQRRRQTTAAAGCWAVKKSCKLIYVVCRWRKKWKKNSPSRQTNCFDLRGRSMRNNDVSDRLHPATIALYENALLTHIERCFHFALKTNNIRKIGTRCVCMCHIVANATIKSREKDFCD